MKRLVWTAFGAVCVVGLLGASEGMAVAKTRKYAEPTVSVGNFTGRYRVLRENQKDTGCLVTLEDRSRGRAYLSPACRDQGMVIFDPIGWASVGNTLVLTARGGHQARFQLQGADLWVKEGKEGDKPLMLRKIQD